MYERENSTSFKRIQSNPTPRIALSVGLLVGDICYPVWCVRRGLGVKDEVKPAQRATN